MPDWNSELLGAAENGDLELLKRAIENGADISYERNCALKLAIDNDHANIFKYLLEKGVEPKVYLSHVLVTMVSVSKHDPIANLFMSFYEDVDQEEVIQSLFKAGLDVTDDDYLAIERASENGHVLILETLLENVMEYHKDKIPEVMAILEDEHKAIFKKNILNKNRQQYQLSEEVFSL